MKRCSVNKFMRTPRPYQSECVDAIWREVVTKDLPSTIVVMATGVGKTLVEAILATKWLELMRQRVLILSHRGTIIDQILKTTSEQARGIVVEVEKAMQFATVMDDELFSDAAQIVVASKDTICQAKRLQRWPRRHFGLIVVDELHHAVPRKNRSYWDIFDYFDEAKRVGLTATIDRADCVCWRNTWHSCAYEFDTLAAVRESWLVPLQSVITHVSGLDFTNLDSVKGDFAPDQLDKLMRQESPKHGLVKPIMDYANMGGQKRKTIIFTTSVAHAHDICAILNEKDPQSAVALDGSSPEAMRHHELERYKRGEFQYLCGCDLFTEGFDEPGIRVVGIGRPTESRAKMCLDDQTEILTDKGWARIDDAWFNESSWVAGYQDGRIAWEPREAIVKRVVEPGEKMVEYVSPALDIRVTANHRMLYGTGNEWKVAEAGTLADYYGFRLPISGTQNVLGSTLANEELFMIGLLTADGWVSKKQSGIVLTQAFEQPWISKIDKLASSLGYRFSRSVIRRSTAMRGEHRQVKWRWSTRSKSKTILIADHWARCIDKKNLAEPLECVTRDQLRHFLAGLNLGDGHKPRRIAWTKRSYDITSFQKGFAEQLQSLCVRRGFKCNVFTGHREWNGKPVTFYCLHIKDTQTAHVAGKERADRPFFRMTDPVGQERVWCVQVPSGAIVTRRNGKVVILGNCQMVGRGLRPLDTIVPELNVAGSPERRREIILGSQKPSCLVVDVVGVTGRHKLATAASVLGDGHYQDEVIELAEKNMDEKGKACEIDQELKRAKLEIEQKAREKRARLQAAVEYSSRFVDPFDLWDVSKDVEPWFINGMPATDKQVGMLSNMGLQKNQLEGLTVHRASRLIEEAKRRKKEGLCTFAQGNLLRRYKYDPKHLTEARAKELIIELRKNGFKPLGRR